MSEHTYTLSEIKDAVFRALDEFSINGNLSDKYSGGLSDINKRFFEALNQSVRKVYLSVERKVHETALSFTKHAMLLEVSKLNISRSQAERISLPQSAGSFCISFTGQGTLTLKNSSEVILAEYRLCSGGGVFETEKDFVPEGCVSAEITSHAGLSILYFKVYSCNFLARGVTEQTLLPDGKNLFCAFPESAVEIKYVSSANTPYPVDLFSFGRGIISCDEKYAGSYRVEYFSYPPKLYETDPPDTPIELSPTACSALIYSTAAYLCADEDGDLYTKLMYRYQEICANRYPAAGTKTRNSFYSSGLFGRRKSRPSFRG